MTLTYTVDVKNTGLLPTRGTSTYPNHILYHYDENGLWLGFTLAQINIPDNPQTKVSTSKPSNAHGEPPCLPEYKSLTSFGFPCLIPSTTHEVIIDGQYRLAYPDAKEPLPNTRAVQQGTNIPITPTNLIAMETTLSPTSATTPTYTYGQAGYTTQTVSANPQRVSPLTNATPITSIIGAWDATQRALNSAIDLAVSVGTISPEVGILVKNTDKAFTVEAANHNVAGFVLTQGDFNTLSNINGNFKIRDVRVSQNNPPNSLSSVQTWINKNGLQIPNLQPPPLVPPYTPRGGTPTPTPGQYGQPITPPLPVPPSSIPHPMQPPPTTQMPAPTPTAQPTGISKVTGLVFGTMAAAYLASMIPRRQKRRHHVRH